MPKGLIGAVVVLAAVATTLLASSSPASVKAAGCISTSDCLSKMTLAEKAGQMTQVANTYLKSNADISTYALGSVLSGGGGGPNGAGGTASQWKTMVDNYQSYALQSRLGIPLIYGIDAVHGNNNVSGAVIFPHNIGMGATRDAALVQQEDDITASGSARHGHPLGLRAVRLRGARRPVGPDLRELRRGPGDREPDWPSAAVTGFQGSALSSTSVLATAKHFVADGGTTYGTGSSGYLIDQGDAQISEAELDAIHLPPFQNAVNAASAR